MLQATDAGCITGSCGTQGRTAHKLKLQEEARNLHKEHSPGGVLHFMRSQALPLFNLREAGRLTTTEGQRGD